MFPLDKDGHGYGVHDPYGENHVDSLSAAHLVWDQIKGHKPLSKAKILEAISSGYFEGYPEYVWDGPDTVIAKEYKEKTGKDIQDEDADPAWKKKWNEAWKRKCEDFEQEVSDAAKALMEKEYPRLKDKKCYTVSFSDKHGDIFCTLEHGDTFKSIPFIKISHH